MATTIINGIECTFPSVPAGVLHSYGVTSRTHYLAYKLSDIPIHNAVISGMLSSAFEFGAFARPPFFCENDGDGRAIILLENPSATVLETILNWITWIVGPNCYKHLYPYQKAVKALMLQAEEMAKDTDRAVDLMRYKNIYNRTRYGENPLPFYDTDNIN